MVYSIRELIYIWETFGIFDYLLPFLLMFAIVFGILQYMRVFGENKGVNVIIALVVGLLAVRWTHGGMLSQFYEEIFPRLGIGVTLILVLLILIGLFVPEDERRYWLWGLGAIGALIAIVIAVQSFGMLGWTGAYAGWFGGNVVGWLAGAVLIIGLIIAIASSTGGGGSSRGPKPAQLLGWFGPGSQPGAIR